MRWKVTHRSFFNSFSSNSTSHIILARKSRQQDLQIAGHIQESREGNAFVLTTWFGWWKFIYLYTVQDLLAREWCLQRWAISCYNNLLKTVFHRPVCVDNLSLRLPSQATVHCVKLTIRENYPRRSRCLSPRQRTWNSSPGFTWWRDNQPLQTVFLSPHWEG